MTLVGSVRATAELERPRTWGYGRYRVDGAVVEFPIDRADVDRDTEWATELLRVYGVGRGKSVHVVCGGWESPWFAPFYRATVRLGGTYTCADIWGWDARRTDLFVRRLTPHLALGITAEVVDGLVGSGAVENLRAVPHVLARPDAASTLDANGVPAGVISPVGPLVALSRPGDTELSYDSSEWQVSDRDGELLVTTAGKRAYQVREARTGVAGAASSPGRLRLLTS